MTLLSHLCNLAATAGWSNMTHSSIEIPLYALRICTRRQKMIRFSTSETFATQSKASVAFSSATRGVGTISWTAVLPELRREELEDEGLREMALPKAVDEVIL